MTLSLPRPDDVVVEHGPAQNPEAAFRRQWAATLVHHVLDEVRKGCLHDGLDAHWTVFEHRIVRPMFLGEPPTKYDELVDRLGIKDTSQAANMMVTVKRRFAGALCVEVGRTVTNRGEIGDEIAELLKDFERPS